MQTETELLLIRGALENLERTVAASGNTAPITHSILLALPPNRRRSAALEDLKEALHDVADRAEYLAEL